MSGGDIKNAVLKAAALAAAEPGPDLGKRIRQQDFECAIERVLAAKAVMQQSLFADSRIAAPDAVSVLAMESQPRTAILVALALGGAALITAFVALL